MDISSYIEYLVDKEHKTADTIYKDRIKNYREFIMSTVKDNKVLEKKFYLVVPFSVLEMGIKNSLSSTGKKKKLPFSKDYILSRAKTSLFPKRDHILRQLGRIGLKGRQLTTQDLVERFFNIYNPTLTGEKLGEISGYTKSIVEGIGKI